VAHTLVTWIVYKLLLPAGGSLNSSSLYPLYSDKILQLHGTVRVRNRRAKFVGGEGNKGIKLWNPNFLRLHHVTRFL
jgi:hypothetical protein